MKWVIRCVALAVATIVGACPLLILSIFFSHGLGGFVPFLIFFILVPVGWVLSAAIAIPGLVLLDRRGWNRWPWGVALGVLVSVIATTLSVGGFLVVASSDPDVHIAHSVAAFLPLVLWGVVMGLLGTGAYWIVSRSLMRWTSETAEQLRLESSLRHLNPEERKALQSRLDR